LSRAEGKLAGFVRETGIDFRGATVLDIGSSTGGWTEFALGAGAAKVIAVEKGTRQMKAPLRFDPRVELHEKTDIFGGLPDRPSAITISFPDIIMADVSFVSLRKVLAYTKAHLAGRDTKLVVLLKPQFEAREEQLVEGVVKNEKMRREIVRNFEGWLRSQGFVVRAKRDSEVRGRHGNLERLYLLGLGVGGVSGRGRRVGAGGGRMASSGFGA
jgi:23S rRNA (cytidine1920-2'-O)/16S rRNA (cytidine1409-2'-O)-methyltransferase